MQSPARPRRWHPRRKRQKAKLRWFGRLVLFLVSALVILAIGAVSFGFFHAVKRTDESCQVEAELPSLRPLMDVGKDLREHVEALRSNTGLTAEHLIGNLVSRPNASSSRRCGAMTDVLLHRQRVRQVEQAMDAAVAGVDAAEASAADLDCSASQTNEAAWPAEKRRIDPSRKSFYGGCQTSKPIDDGLRRRTLR